MDPFKEEKLFKKKEEKKRKRKRDQDVKIPRNVSTFLAGEKAKTPAVRLSFYRPVCVQTLSYKHTYMYIPLESEVGK